MKPGDLLSLDGPTLTEWWDALDAFDWFYDMSDEVGVWTRGAATYQGLERMAKRLGPEHEAMLKQFEVSQRGPLRGVLGVELPPRPRSC